MPNLEAKPCIRPQVLEEAAGWLIEFRAGDPGSTERRSFDAWLRASPEHVRAYLILLPIWESNQFSELPDAPSVDTLIQWARLPDDNIVSLSSAGARVEASQPACRGTSKVRKTWRMAATASLLVACCVGYWAFSTWRHPVYATGIGEQTVVTLSDGTTVNLNVRTRIKLRYSDHERRIELQHGQALFQVAKDTQRPFIVSADATKIRAVGTQFDIYRKSTGTVVTVVEGRVAVLSSSPGMGGGGTLLSAGEQLTVVPVAPKSRASTAFENQASQSSRTSHPSRTPTRVNVKTATAWMQHRLIFSATPLIDVAEEFNRYNSRQLIIDDIPELQGFRINGVFSSADPTALLAFLSEQSSIAITESGKYIHVSRK
jgi:transmembrane sensor